MPWRHEVQFLGAELLTFVAAAAVALCVHSFLPHTAPAGIPGEYKSPAAEYFPFPSSDYVRAGMALRHFLREGHLVVMGSSELTTHSETAVQKYYPKACGKPVLSLGSEGFQTLPIFVRLAANRAALGPKSKLVIILSPIWFTEHGTPSEAFLRFLNPHELRAFAQDPDTPPELMEALQREVRMHMDHFTGLYPDWLWISYPWLAKWARPWTSPRVETRVDVEPVDPVNGFNWASEEEKWKADLARLAEGNPLGTNIEYYRGIQKFKPPYAFRPLDPWSTEKRDLFALSKFLKDRGVKAEFVYQPAHRRVYAPLEKLDALTADIEKKLTDDGHRFNNFFKEPFDLSILENGQHFSDYAWVKLQKEWCTL